MQEKIEEIKVNVEQYKLLLSKKEELEKEYGSWVELYGELTKELSKVRELYKNDNSEQAKLALDASLKEEKEYLEIINEYGARLKAINDEFNTYDHETLENQRQYLANITRFKELSKLMKEIEKRSKKIANGAKIGTNCIKIANAEGRDKNIHEYFAEEYRALAAEKRELAKTIRKQDRMLFTEPVKKEEETIDVINPPKPEVEYEEDYWEKLSPEEKIVELEKRLERMLQARGKKRIIHYKGESIRISEHYYKQYPRIRSEINKLKKEIEERDNLAKDANLTSPYVEEMTVTDLSSGRKNPFMDLPLNDPRQVGEIVDDNPFVGVAPVTPLTGGSKPMYDISLDDFTKKEDSAEDRQFELENEELLAMVNRHASEVKKEEEPEVATEKQKGFLKVLNIRKPKSLEKLKEKIKKAACVIAATVVVGVMATPLVTTIVESINKSNNDADLDEPNIGVSDTVVEEDIKSDLDVVIQEDDQQDVDTETPQEEKEEAVFKLGDAFALKEGVKIYNNMYDAILGRNGLSPYFGTDGIERQIGGVAVNYEGQLYFFYANDPQSEENMNMLLANGGKVASVLAMNEHGYEGFYNVNDIVSLSKDLGGVSR